MHPIRRLVLPIVCAAATLACAACGSTKASRYYMLDARAAVAPTASEDVAPRTIRLGPVTLPGYLDRHQMVSRVPSNSVRLAQYDRWAEPLKEGVPRVLATNLSALLPGDRVLPYPSGEVKTLDYRVHVDIHQLDGVPGGQAYLVAHWTIRSVDGGVTIRQPMEPLTVNVADATYDALARAESELLLELARRIAADLDRTTGSTAP